MTMHLNPDLLKIHTENKLLIEIPRAEPYCVFIQLSSSIYCNRGYRMQSTNAAQCCGWSEYVTASYWVYEAKKDKMADFYSVEHSVFAPLLPTESLNQTDQFD